MKPGAEELSEACFTAPMIPSITFTTSDVTNCVKSHDDIRVLARRSRGVIDSFIAGSTIVRTVPILTPHTSAGVL